MTTQQEYAKKKVTKIATYETVLVLQKPHMVICYLHEF